MILLGRFSIECRKAKTKVITSANHKGHRQYSEQIKTQSRYMQLIKSAGKRVRTNGSGEWGTGNDFGFTSDWMKTGARFLSQSRNVLSAKPITSRHTNENPSISTNTVRIP